MTQSPLPASRDATPVWISRVGLALGPLAMIAILLAPVPVGLTTAAWRTAAIGALMAIWWITEAVPLAATALLPLVLLPLLGITSQAGAATPFANPVIFLFLGGFVLAIAVEECGLHRRLAITVIGLAGTRPASLVGGFMAATAFISLWVSNTATTLMMLPLATSVVAMAEGDSGTSNDSLAPALLLGVAYASSIGGMATLIGTPPNALFSGFASQTLQRPVSFATWMMIGVPLLLVALPLSWLILTRVSFKLGRDPIAGGEALVERERASLGPISRAERVVAGVAALAALAWVTRPLYGEFLPGVSDASIAVSAALILLMVPIYWNPIQRVVEWHHVERLPWGVLILFGGGLSLADAMQSSGLAAWLGESMAALSALPFVLLLLILVSVVVFFGELASNLAMTAAFLPISVAVAGAIGVDPLHLAVAVTLAASAGFMLPVATPPNAIVYATGRVSTLRMVRTGILLDLLLIVLIVIAVLVLAQPVFGSSAPAAP